MIIIGAVARRQNPDLLKPGAIRSAIGKLRSFLHISPPSSIISHGANLITHQVL